MSSRAVHGERLFFVTSNRRQEVPAPKREGLELGRFGKALMQDGTLGYNSD